MTRSQHGSRLASRNLIPSFFLRLDLLVRLDVKQQLTSVWFYLILLGNLSLPPSWYLCYPDKESLKVLLVDDLKNRNVEDIRISIQEEGFQVHLRYDLDEAMKELLSWKASAIIHIDGGGRVNWYAATPRMRKLFTRAIRASMLNELNKKLNDVAGELGESRFELPLIPQHYFVGHERKQISMVTFLVRTTWYFAGLVTLTMFILARPYLSKLQRIYSTTMILLGKVISGTMLGSLIMVLFLAWILLAGFSIPNFGAYLLDFFLVVLNGVAFGCVLGAVPLAISRDLLGLVFGALMTISLSFMGLGQLSAFLTPISNMHPLVYMLDTLNPLYLSNQVIHNCAFLGDSLLDPRNSSYLSRFVGETGVLMVVARIALGRA